MTVTVRDLGDIILYLGGLAGALAAIGLLLRLAFLRPLKRWIAEQVGAVQATADQVHAEVMPNHGTSLKDTVIRTEIKVDQLDRRFTDHLTNHPRGA